MSTPTTQEYTLGVEEEYQILDPKSRELLAEGGQAVQQRARRATMGEEVMPELLTSQVEAVSPICRTLEEVRAELLRLRQEVSKAAAKEGARISAASTHPFSDWRDQRITPKERYKGILENYQRLAREQAAFGFHVHVGLADREAAIRV
ncbi:MAG: carboxylate-amine ligase, partial [Rubrobacter sp.]|nr:carboxylate-amine ligase [Rubrobacter sp.]